MTRSSKIRWVWTIGVAVVYLALSVAVTVHSPLDNLDQRVLHWNLSQRWPKLEPWILHYVIIGQRGPATLVALPWVIWRCWRLRTTRPIVRLLLALALLNLSVGVVKTIIGRLGPQVTSHATAVFDGGDIFPSGHTSNAVVLFGVLAWMTTRYRRTAITTAVFLSLTVGLGTIYLDTHWVTDVLGGWLAGALVLLVLPPLMPFAERVTERLVRWCAGLPLRVGHFARAALERTDRATPGQTVRAARTPALSVTNVETSSPISSSRLLPAASASSRLSPMGRRGARNLAVAARERTRPGRLRPRVSSTRP